ncbi:MAG: ion channel [Candidatus Cloacimonetes bacterium]|nr:NAD-binding protein [Candidatus Cloacimonadota bacterium]MDD2719592.1 ion channel [Candidatus Cloacimonadota bacterium]MDD3097941.1 ion channel [Candidatus Cloacimonadota bacterium]MDD3578169.1 ion channel [Candidatus Cloacimonadota bacterium]MDD4791304.1 ion channel [Candidatus Cloacimonadota bacterium]
MRSRAHSLHKKLRQKARYYNLSLENQRLIFRFLWVCLFIVILLLVSAGLIWLFEYKGQSSNTIDSFWDGIWWAVVTIATVGYGDKFPVTYAGRVVGLILIIIGFVSLSAFTGLIASLFVEDRMKGAKGLKKIRSHNHIVLCGWNNTAHNFLRALVEKNMENVQVCLVMNETPEFYESLESSYPTLSLSFVRGEPTQEDSLKRANVAAAKQIIILADHTLESSNADDRSIIVANAVHFMTKKDKISVQLINNENKQMLQRIGINRVFVWDDLGAYLLADNIADDNSLSIFTQIAKSPQVRICTCAIEAELIGKSYGDLFEYINAKQDGILIGLITKESELELDSIFDDDSSAIDQFIKSTLRKSQKMTAEDRNSIRINPPRDYRVQDNDMAILLRSEIS